MKLLFFDDNPMASDNKLFVLRLKDRFSEAELEVVGAKSVREAEHYLRTEQFDVIILDIIARMSTVVRDKEISNQEIPDAVTGIELLRRCRKGAYGQNNRVADIYMRSARGEMHIRRMCKDSGASGYFRAGIEDTQLIERLMTWRDSEGTRP